MKARGRPTNDMRPEYDFESMKGGVRGKYVTRYRSGTNLVLLDPEVAEAFPTDAAVNEALRVALDMANVVRRVKRLSNKALRPASRARRHSRKPTQSRADRG
jgi:hypothetical protein